MALLLPSIRTDMLVRPVPVKARKSVSAVSFQIDTASAVVLRPASHVPSEGPQSGQACACVASTATTAGGELVSGGGVEDRPICPFVPIGSSRRPCFRLSTARTGSKWKFKERGKRGTSNGGLSIG